MILEDHTWWDPMHLLESYDNFAIFVAQEFWKFDAIPPRFTMPRFPRFSTIFQIDEISKLVRISWCAHVIPDIERRNVFANCRKLRIWKTDTETNFGWKLLQSDASDTENDWDDRSFRTQLNLKDRNENIFKNSKEFLRIWKK